LEAEELVEVVMKQEEMVEEMEEEEMEEEEEEEMEEMEEEEEEVREKGEMEEEDMGEQQLSPALLLTEKAACVLTPGSPVTVSLCSTS
jgi:hypothetical protein